MAEKLKQKQTLCDPSRFISEKAMYWIIEEDIFPHLEKNLEQAIEKSGNVYVKYIESMDVTSKSPAIFLGSLDAACIYGMFGAINLDRFYYSYYYKHLSDMLLNRNPTFLTLSELINIDTLPPRIFVRPDSPFKPFSGRVIDTKNMSIDMFEYGIYHEDLNLPVLFDEAVNIDREFRFIVLNCNVIAACEYKNSEGISGVVPDLAYEMANCMTKNDWQPAWIYAADIVQVDGEMKLLELNLFSGTDLYTCDIDNIVYSVSKFMEGMG